MTYHQIGGNIDSTGEIQSGNAEGRNTMKRYTIYENEPITNEMMNVIGSYMDDDIREEIHGEVAPCTPDEFLTAYLEKDPEFLGLLENEFNLKEV